MSNNRIQQKLAKEKAKQDKENVPSRTNVPLIKRKIQENVLPVKKARQKMDEGDRTFNPKGKSGCTNKSDHHESFVHSRSDKSLEITKAANKVVPVRCTFALNFANIEFYNFDVPKERIIALMIEQIESLSSSAFGKIEEVLERNENLSPIKLRIKSPTKNSNNTYEVTCDSKIGTLRFYSNRGLPVVKDHAPVKQLKASSDFFESDAYKKIVKHLEARKEQALQVTLALLNKTRKTNAEKGSRREPTQIGAMKVSAREYAEAMGIFLEGLKWDWLHIIAYFIVGDPGQCPENLFAGTDFANTEMLFVESELAAISRLYPRGFNLRGSVRMMEKTEEDGTVNEHLEMGTYVDYEIETDDFKLSFTFDAQSKNQPHIEFYIYLKALIKTVLILSKEKENLKTEEKENNRTQEENNQPAEDDLQDRSIMLHCY